MSPHKRKIRVLVMDDELSIRNLLACMLTMCNYEPDFAVNGSEALEKYQQAQDSQRPFDAVIMDLNITDGMDGRKAVKELLKMHPEARVIVSSGDLSDLAMINYKAYGFSAALPKPFTITELKSVLHEIGEVQREYR